MRLDVLTIFPDYLSGLRLSLIGKAVSAGLLSLDVRDLREHTHDRHRTVDDTPYGGGAGMVMCPEPWGEALDAVLADAAEAGPGAGTALGEPASGTGGAAEAADERPVLIVPSPAGDVFDQAMARELAGRRHLVFACGRYEGIDQRVIDDAAGSFDVRMVSIGDYVLNGGEVATMVMVEAIARLLPGVIGNPASLDEESHEDGLLEYPVYTKPAEWRGRRVPDILLSGDHGRIARWRRDERLRRTAAVRPDLLAALDDSRLDAHDRRVLDEIASAARAEAADGDGGVERDR